MTTAFRGRDAALYLGDGGSPETFTKFAGARTTGMTLNDEAVDITNIDSNGFRELLPNGGVQSMDVRVEGVVTNSAVYLEVQTQATERTTRRYQFRSGNGDVWECDMVVQSLERTGTYNGAETFSLSLQSTGAIVFGTAS